jgi:hypothetical protein
VPRFFFHVFDTAVSRDHLVLHHRVDVEQEGGGTVLSLSFGDAFTIEP